MRTHCRMLAIVLLAVAASGSCAPGVEDESGAAANEDAKLRVAVVTGGHAFDVPHFYQMLRKLPGIDAYPQHLEHFASSDVEVRDKYDAVIFYGMEQPLPADGKPKEALERLVEQGQGIVILHHALLAWKDWGLWNELIGYDNRNFAFKEGLELKVAVAKAGHPIIKGIDSLEIHDEGYKLHGTYDGQGNVLLTTDHQDAMPQVAWARQHEKSRVFCLALGHDDQAWTNPGFVKVLAQGVAWSAEEE